MSNRKFYSMNLSTLTHSYSILLSHSSKWGHKWYNKLCLTLKKSLLFRFDNFYFAVNQTHPFKKDTVMTTMIELIPRKEYSLGKRDVFLVDRFTNVTKYTLKSINYI